MLHFTHDMPTLILKRSTLSVKYSWLNSVSSQLSAVLNYRQCSMREYAYVYKAIRLRIPYLRFVLKGPCCAIYAS